MRSIESDKSDENPFEPEIPPFVGDHAREFNPFADLRRPVSSRLRQVWAIGGGKGGVGKSLISSSIAIALARQSFKVIAIDLDLGGANLHTTLGVDIPKKTITDFLSRRESRLSDTLVPTGVSRLEMISGAQDSVRISELSPDDKSRILQGVLELDADYVILDLGAGTNLTTTDFFLFADIGILAMLPEPTSIENAYRFIKSVYFRRLLISPSLEKVRSTIEIAMDAKNDLGIRNPSDLFREISNSNPEAGMRLKEEIQKFKPKLVVNQTRTQTDVDIGTSVRTVCKRYFGIDMDYIGYLDHDSSVWQAVRRKRPLMLEFPNSKLVSSFERIAQYLIRRHADSRNDMISER